KQVSVSSIVQHTVCLFFSAHWCRPCRTFTPQLIQAYNELKQKGDNLEVIFISFDKDEACFLEHYKAMPWLALPFDEGLRRRICSQYKVDHIPALIPLDCNVKTIVADAVQLIEDYGVDAFPFTFERREKLKAIDEERKGCTLQALLVSDRVNHLYSNNGIQVPLSNLTGRTIGLYFAANWSPPCKDFTSQLVRVYDDLKVTNGDQFEVVMVSSDRDQCAFNQCKSTMPWLAIPFDSKARHELFRIFNIKAIPALVFIGPKGEPYGTDGREMITCHGAKAFPFTEERAVELGAAVEREKEGLADQVKDQKHKHLLKLDMRKAFICNGCRKEGRFWSFCCRICNFDLHPDCVMEENETKIKKEGRNEICIPATKSGIQEFHFTTTTYKAISNQSS
ncbi:putative nucleoredoxin 3, partial [Nymphaea thermarum]